MPLSRTELLQVSQLIRIARAKEATGFLEIMVGLPLLGVWGEYYSSAPTHKRNKLWLVRGGVALMLILRLALFT